jgi:isopenicillin-N N-acyltransferase-like protein
MEPVVFDQADPTSRGEAHGELWREEIQALAEIRTQLSMQRGKFADLDELLAVSGLHLPVLERVAPNEHAEFLGIARAADISPERLVILNHYTDLRDVPPSVLAEGQAQEGEIGGGPTAEEHDPGGCTALYVHGHEGPVLGQTWDMHGTAAEFVRMVRICPKGSDREVLTFTLTGCLGMTGINQHGLAVTINNLTSTDAQVGLLWPALVRRMLEHRTADAAREELMGTRLSSGHHYMMADRDTFHGVETSGKIKVQTQHGANTAHVHTNHCFDPVLRKYERVAPISTTFKRMEIATTLYAQLQPETADEVWGFLSSHDNYPRSLCSHVDDASGDPSASRTCGLIVMNLAGGRVLAVRGCAHQNDRVELGVERWQGLPPITDGGPKNDRSRREETLGDGRDG